MDIHSLPCAVSVAPEITRVVDGRCYSLAKPGTTVHPLLIIFGRGPSNRMVYVLDDGALAWSPVVKSGGAWSFTLNAATGRHNFCVCTSDGVVSPCWEITIEVSTEIQPPISVMTSDPEVYRFDW
jgi:hypothetical protein